MSAPRVDTAALIAGTPIQSGGYTLMLRPIRADDGPLWLELVRAMSLATRYKRGARRAEDLSAADVERAVTPDPENEIAFGLVATRGADATMIGVSRAKRIRPDAWEFAIVVLDEWQGRGLGRALMQALMDALAARGVTAIEGDVLGTNRSMLEFLAHLGFTAGPHPENAHLKRVARVLPPAPHSAPAPVSRK